jgi:hypothetical protein
MAQGEVLQGELAGAAAEEREEAEQVEHRQGELSIGPLLACFPVSVNAAAELLADCDSPRFPWEPNLVS